MHRAERAKRRMGQVKQSELNNKIKNTCLRGLNCKGKEICSLVSLSILSSLRDGYAS